MQTKETKERLISGAYETFASYAEGEIRCQKCGSGMKLKKGVNGRYYLGCSQAPTCAYTASVEPEDVEKYLCYENGERKRCPKDNTPLEARVGQFGAYVRCGANEKHFYKLDEI